MEREQVWIYIGIDPRGYVKIGSSTDPHSRMTALKLESLGVMPGTVSMEKRLHRRLKRHCICGTEWFAPSMELFKYIEKVPLKQIQRWSDWDELVSRFKVDCDPRKPAYNRNPPSVNQVQWTYPELNELTWSFLGPEISTVVPLFVVEGRYRTRDGRLAVVSDFNSKTIRSTGYVEGRDWSVTWREYGSYFHTFDEKEHPLDLVERIPARARTEAA